MRHVSTRRVPTPNVRLWAAIVALSVIGIVLFSLTITFGVRQCDNLLVDANLLVRDPVPVLFAFGGNYHWFYELEIRNLTEIWYLYVIQVRGTADHNASLVFENQIINDNYAIVRDNNTVLRRQFALSVIGTTEGVDPVLIQNGSSASSQLKILIYMSAVFNQSDPFLLQSSAQFEHRLFFSNSFDRVYKIRTGPVITVPPVSALTTLIRAGRPFPLFLPNSTQRALCFIAGGPGINSRHRTAITPLPGPLYLAQKYAIDWMLLNDTDGRAYRNDGTQNGDWYGYGAPVLAVTMGTVVSVQDGLADNTPGQPPVIAINKSSVIGNAIVIEVAASSPPRYVLYAHLKPGSLLVTVGQSVTEGQQLAQMGNSGNTLAPHLHLHISNGPQPIESESVPYHYKSFEYVGECPEDCVLAGTSCFSPYIFQPSTLPVAQRTDELPLDASVLYFL
jgi:murein DD-endopeptidase MepM/ murein hydrolase activator NlpD